VYPYSVTYCRALPLIGKTTMYGVSESQSMEETLVSNAAKYFYDKLGAYYLENFGDLG
jgi:hypothetical protein